MFVHEHKALSSLKSLYNPHLPGTWLHLLWNIRIYTETL